MTPPPAFHLVWDWNGTLFDDLHIVMDALNITLAELDAEPVDVDAYRTFFRRPVRGFYEALLVRTITSDEWSMIDTVFHTAYRDRLDRAALARDAELAFRAVHDVGGEQSLLSMWWHEELVKATKKLGVDPVMTHIDGNRLEAGGAKAEHLVRHLGDIDPATVVVVGDTFDDMEAADAVGAYGILYDGGSHHRHDLEAAGRPVADSLVEAVDLAFRR